MLMYNLFEVKSRYDKMNESGIVKKVTETHLVDAMSHAEAEEIATQKLSPFVSGEFEIASVRRMRLYDTYLSLDDGDDIFYRVGLKLPTVNERTGGESCKKVTMLVVSSSIEGAIDATKERMQRTIEDYTIVSVAETPVVDLFCTRAKER
ncbi:MAG: DUF4494 family protein [Bacteroidales bacterium]